MIKNIQRYFERHIGGSENTVAADPQHRLHLAAAALLIEMARIDYAEAPEEIVQIAGLLRSHFGLGDPEVEELLNLAGEEADQMTSYFQFTTTINKECDIADKAHILKLLWQVAYADGKLDKYEHHMIRKIANLLYVPRETQVAARRAAQKETGSRD